MTEISAYQTFSIRLQRLLAGIFGYWTGPRDLWLEFLGTRQASHTPGLSFWVPDWTKRPLIKVFGYWTGSRGLWLEFFGTRLAPEAPDWNFLVPDSFCMER